MGWRLGDIISSSRVRLKRETLRQVAEEGQNTRVPGTVLSVIRDACVCKVILDEEERPSLGSQEPVTLYFALAR